MRALLVKLQPNQDVTEALEAEVRMAGMARAYIVAAVGSLVEGVLAREGSIEQVDGPAIEVAALSGQILASGGSRLHGYLCRKDASVVAGVLEHGSNAVGVTFEVMLQEMEA